MGAAPRPVVRRLEGLGQRLPDLALPGRERERGVVGWGRAGQRVAPDGALLQRHEAVRGERRQRLPGGAGRRLVEGAGGPPAVVGRRAGRAGRRGRGQPGQGGLLHRAQPRSRVGRERAGEKFLARGHARAQQRGMPLHQTALFQPPRHRHGVRVGQARAQGAARQHAAGRLQQAERRGAGAGSGAPPRRR